MFAFVDPFRRDDGPRANIITKTNGPTLSTIEGFPLPRSLRRPPVARSPGGIFIRTRIDWQNRGRWFLRSRENFFFFSRKRLPKLLHGISNSDNRHPCRIIMRYSQITLLANGYRHQISDDTRYRRITYRYESPVIVSPCRDTIIN